MVVAWDLAHNGVSSAFMLADVLGRDHDVEIIGPSFLGAEIWEPIRATEIPIRSFPGRALPGFIEDAERFVSSMEADVIYASKPRFPTLLLSMLLKDQCGAPVIVHVDDLELAFVGAPDAISLDELERRRGAPDFADPTGPSWVSACDALIRDADAITVSGEVLRRRYGGVVLGQVRDETLFDPALVDRDQVRAEFGYSRRDQVVLFLGSPRARKGVLELARAVAAIDDHRVKLCVIGSFADPGLREAVARCDRRRVRLVDYRPVSDVPRLTMIGDLVCLPQDSSAASAAYQTPMKLTEALAMGVPVLARETPSLAAFAQRGLIETIGAGSLSARIAELFGDPDRLREMAHRGREFFLGHLSYDVALGTLEEVIGGLPRCCPEVPPSWERACELASSA
jgi:glycosyltransferase involved in cell wall biosynthesis